MGAEPPPAGAQQAGTVVAWGNPTPRAARGEAPDSLLEPDEPGLIATVLSHRPDASRHRAPAHPSATPGDDAAVVADGVVVTVDTMVQGVHWDHRSSAEDVGFKLAAVNASDVGAMGCRPTWAVLAMALPAPADAAWIESFSHGLGAGLARFGAQLVGGDTTRAAGDAVVLSLTMAGAGAAPVPRSRARPGDELWVTGTLGEAAAGFLHDDPDGLDWLRRPRPPVSLGAVLADRGLVRAMMDLSDGLAADLPRLCAASGVGARVSSDALPRGAAVSRRPVDEQVGLQVAFGDDYQLLFAAASADADELRRVAADHDVAVHRIGRVVEGSDVLLDDGPFPAPTWQHFPVRGEPPPAPAASARRRSPSPRGAR